MVATVGESYPPRAPCGRVLLLPDRANSPAGKRPPSSYYHLPRLRMSLRGHIVSEASMRSLKVAKHITLTKDGRLIIDGEEFGYHLAQEAITASVDPEGLACVNVTILADGFDYDYKAER